MRVAGLLLVWALVHPAGSQQCHLGTPGGVLRFTDRHADIRVPAMHRVPSSLDPLYGLVRRCLDLIQQNPLPTGEPRAGEPAQHHRGDRDPPGCGRGVWAASWPRCPGRAGGGPGGTSVTGGAVVSFAELLRAALNDPGSVRTSQVSQDAERETPPGWHPLGTGHPQLGAWVLTGLSRHVGGAV